MKARSQLSEGHWPYYSYVALNCSAITHNDVTLSMLILKQQCANMPQMFK
jgi:hypothetical protein